MKNKFNTLKPYIYEYSQKELRKKTINGLFRAILEPVISNQKFECCILFRILEIQGKESLLKRLGFAGAKLFSFSENLNSFNIKDSQKDTNIWGKTEFLIVLGQRYSACLIWDYSSSNNQDSSEVCLLYNSKIISNIAKQVLENSKDDFENLIEKYSPDRRENKILNGSINNIALLYNDTNEEIMYTTAEKDNYLSDDETKKTAQIVSDKAKFISHEIKNNLSVINLYSKILEKRFQSIQMKSEILSSVNNAINSINNASEHISSLIGELRCISAPYYTKESIKKIILNTLMQCAVKTESLGIETVLEEFDDVIINTDKVKIECALMNIIFNAAEASSKGSKITIFCNRENDKFTITIKNNGKEIPKDIQTQIFEPEFTTKEKGNGLGLAICKNQLQLIGGDIELVKSDKDETVFKIVLNIK